MLRKNSELYIILFLAENDATPSFYMHIGSWVYPLVPGVSPMLQTNSRTFIIPDLQASIPGSFFYSNKKKWNYYYLLNRTHHCVQY